MCAGAGLVLVTAKFGADLYTHGWGYAAENGIVNVKGYAIGLAVGGAGGASLRGLQKANLPPGRHATRYLRAPRHAAGPRHAASPDRWLRGAFYGGGSLYGQLGCGTTYMAPGWC